MLRTADKGTTALIEASQLTALLRNSDADALADRTCWANRRSKPEGLRLTQILTIAIHIDCHRLGQTSRPPHEINNGCCSPVMFHLRDSLEGFKRAKQNPGADSWLLAGNVQQIGHSIVEKDICVSISQKKRPVSCSRPSISMTAGITWRIGLRFNNPSAQADIPKIADKSFADQKSRELDGAGGQLCPA